MHVINPWRLIKKKVGRTTPNATFRLELAYRAALKELADEETKRLGVTISQAALIQNLTTRDSNFYRTKRVELRKKWDAQLNKENQHVTDIQDQKESQP